MQLLKQSTAVSKIVGPILDSTGAEYASAVIGDLSLSKNGGTLTALAATATLTYIANGMYTLALTTGNTDTLGSAEVSCNKSTYQMPPREFMVLNATTYDALVTNAAGGANGLLLSLASNQVDVGKLLGTAWLTPAVAGTPDVNAKQAGGTVWGSGAITAASIATDAITAAKIADGAIDAATFAAGAINAAAIASDAITDAKVASDVTIASVTGAVGSVTGAVGSVSGNVGGNVVGSVASVAGAVGSVTGNVGGNVVGSVGSVSGAVGSVTGNVGGNVVGSVGSVAAGVDISTGSGNALVAATASASAALVTTDHGAGSYIRNTEPPTAAANASAVRTELATELGRIDAAVTTRPTLAQILAGGDVDGFTLEQTMKLCLAALAGKLSGAATATVVIRAADDSKARITAVCDADGNRTAITYDAAG